MEAKIVRNIKRDGLNISFDSKPDKETLSYLKEHNFRWNPYEKYWYRKYSESLEKQIREYFSGKQIPGSESQKGTHVSAPEESKEESEEIRIAKAKAKARIRILKLKLQISGKEKEQFAEGGNIPISKQFMGIYDIVKKAKAVNVSKFAQEIGAENQYNKPLFDYLVGHGVPCIKVDKQSLKTHALFKLYPPPIDRAVFWCTNGAIGGKRINNIYVSVLPSAYISLGSYSIKLKIPYAETLENVFTHEAIHAYYNDVLKENKIFENELNLLRELMQQYIEANFNEFDDFELMVWSAIYGDEIQVAMNKKPSVSELITYSFTMKRIKEFFQKMFLQSKSMDAWDSLLTLVSAYDTYGHLLLYAQKYGDLPAMQFSRSLMKYKLYLRSTENNAETKMDRGGMVKGNSHAQGGEDFVVENTGQTVELEGGEAVIMKKAVNSDKKYEFEGKRVKPKQILNKINQDQGGKPIH
jgi:hypothetical protein